MFEKIDFEGIDIEQLITLCLKCSTEEEARQVLEQYEKYCDSPEIARRNLGYIFGYCGKEDREKLYRLFPVSHPVFGQGFGRDKELKPAEILEKGYGWVGDKMGIRRLKIRRNNKNKMTEITIKVWDRTCPDCGSTNLDYLGDHCEGNKYRCRDCECEFVTYLYEVLGEVEYRAEVVSKCQNCGADIVLTRHGDKATGTCDSCGSVIEEE